MKVPLSKNVFENLVQHLVEIREEKNKVIEEYFPEPSVERREIEKLIERYIEHLDQLIRNAEKSETADRTIPIAIIGSEVVIQDLSDQEVFKYRIVSPFSGNIKKGDVSYLSPVGKSLLLKKVGDEVEVTAPGGVFHYKIKSILLPYDSL